MFKFAFNFNEKTLKKYAFMLGTLTVETVELHNETW